MDGISTLDVITILIAVGAFCLSLYNTWKQHHVRGPEFNIAEANTRRRGIASLDDVNKRFFYFKVLVQNIGDRMGLLRWEKIYIKLPTKANIVRGSPAIWECEVAPGSQKKEKFQFEFLTSTDFTGGFFVAKGVYSNHEGKGMIKNTWKTPLSGRLKPKEKKEERRVEDES